MGLRIANDERKGNNEATSCKQISAITGRIKLLLMQSIYRNQYRHKDSGYNLY